MKLAPGSPLQIAWQPDAQREGEPVARLAMAAGATGQGGSQASSQGRAQLEWTPAALHNPRDFSALRYPPEPGLIAARTGEFGGLHGFLADSLPDAWGMLLLRRQVTRLGHDFDALNAVDRLALVGERGRGALTFMPATLDDVHGDADANTIDLDRIAHESALVLRGQQSPLGDWLARLAAGSGGARPKAHIAIHADGRVAAGDARAGEGDDSSEWIVKFAAPDDPADIAAVEMAYANMACAAGLDMAPSRLLGANGETSGIPSYFATRRFDRPAPGKRVHMVSLAGAIEASPHMPSVDYDGFLKAVLAITRDVRDVEKAFRRMVFNVLAINRDDHARQHAFLMGEDGIWQLAPAFDLTFSNGPGGEHYMAVEGEGAAITRAHVASLGQRHGLRDRQIADVIEAVRAALTAWPELAETYGASRSRAAIAKALERKDREFLA